MPKYDINDPTDLDIMRAQFDMLSHEDWAEYIEFAEAKSIGYKKINVLKSSSRKAGIAKYLSPKVISWVLDIVDNLEEMMDDEDYEDEEEWIGIEMGIEIEIEIEIEISLSSWIGNNKRLVSRTRSIRIAKLGVEWEIVRDC